MKDIIRICNPTVRFSKFTFNIKVYDKFKIFFSKLVWRETLFFLEKKLKFNLYKVYHYGFELFVYRIEKGENMYFFVCEG